MICGDYRGLVPCIRVPWPAVWSRPCQGKLYHCRVAWFSTLFFPGNILATGDLLCWQCIVSFDGFSDYHYLSVHFVFCLAPGSVPRARNSACTPLVDHCLLLGAWVPTLA